MGDLDEGLRRIYEYCLPRESARIRQRFPQMAGSNVSKVLIVNREIVPGRVTAILVREKLGF